MPGLFDRFKDTKPKASELCKRCGHPVTAHHLDLLTVGDCGEAHGEHPEMVWRMECAGLRTTRPGEFVNCDCGSFEIAGGVAPGPSHPG